MPTAVQTARLVATGWVISRPLRAAAGRAGGRLARRAGSAGAELMVRTGRRVAATPAPIGISVMYTGAGVMHFARPDFFEAIVPDWFPSPRLANLVSGGAEVALGLLVLPRPTRQAALWGLAVLTVAVFPANVDAAINDVEVRRDDGRFVRSVGTAEGPARIANWVRLPMQLPMLWWIVRRARAQ